MPTERQDVILLGRTIGTADGWDGDESVLTFYHFEPVAALSTDLDAGDLTVNLESGIFEYYDDAGTVTKTIDALDTLAKVTRDGPTV